MQGWNRVGLNTVVFRVRGENPVLVSCRVSECETRNMGIRIPCSVFPLTRIVLLIPRTEDRDSVPCRRRVQLYKPAKHGSNTARRVGNWLDHFKLKVYPK